MYVYHFNKVKKRDSHPEIVTLGLISFCQGTNLISILILISFIIEFTISKSIMLCIMILIFIANYYYYQTKGKGKMILEKEEAIKYSNIYSFVYSLLSAALPLALIYIKNEIL